MPKFRNPSALALYKKFVQGSELLPPSVPTNGIGELVLNISQGCNLGCTYCFADKGQYGSKDKGFMSFEKARLAIDAFLLRYKNIKSVKFFGGEPTMNFQLMKDVCHYFDRLLEIGKISFIPQPMIVTNLTLLNDEMIDYFVKYRFGVTVSLDGPAEINDSFRIFDNRTGSFNMVDKNIHRLKERMGKYNLGIEAVYSPQHMLNNMSMADLHRFFVDRYNRYNIVIHPLLEMEFSKMIFSCFSRDIVQRYYDSIFDLSYEYGKYMVDLVSRGKEVGLVYALVDGMSTKTHVDSHCGLGVNTISIMSDGAVYPCYTLTNKEEFHMGNVSDSNVFSDKFINVQAKFLKNRKSDNPICAKCDILDTCSACPGNMYGKYGEINAAVPLMCDYYVGLREGMLIGVDELLRTDPSKWQKFIDTLQYIRQLSEEMERGI